jgi:hypothetical protein
MDEDKLRKFIIDEISEMTTFTVTGETALVGKNTVLASHDVVALLLAVEDFLEDTWQIEFDWMSDAIMSDARSFLRSVDVLVSYVFALGG